MFTQKEVQEPKLPSGHRWSSKVVERKPNQATVVLSLEKKNGFMKWSVLGSEKFRLYPDDENGFPTPTLKRIYKESTTTRLYWRLNSLSELHSGISVELIEFFKV